MALNGTHEHFAFGVVLFCFCQQDKMGMILNVVALSNDIPLVPVPHSESSQGSLKA